MKFLSSVSVGCVPACVRELGELRSCLLPAENRVVRRPEQRWEPGLQRVLQIPEGAREETAAHVQESGPEQRW